MIKQADLRILYLRTYRDQREDFFDTLRMSDWCHSFGSLVMIGSKNEHEKLQAKFDGMYIDGSSFDDHVDFIESTDANWAQHAISEIVAADAIIMWIRPKEDGFPPLIGTEIPVEDYASYYKTPLSSNRVGAGLLMEVSYLSRLRAIEKTIVLGHSPDIAQFESFICASTAVSGGDVFSVHDGQLKSVTPRLSALDKNLAAFEEINYWISYSREPQQNDSLQMTSEIGRSLEKILSYPKSTVPEGALLFGTSTAALPVFPDYDDKIVQYTPVEKLVSLPHGQLVETSLPEVKEIAGHEGKSLVCPHCQSSIIKIFFYKQGLGLSNSASETIRARCQGCARRSTLVDGLLLDF